MRFYRRAPQRLLHGGFPPLVPLDDCRLEWQPAQLRNPQLHLAGLGLQFALVVAGSAIHPLRRSLIALRSADLIRLRIHAGSTGGLRAKEAGFARSAFYSRRE